jgi:hypothetical protein
MTSQAVLAAQPKSEPEHLATIPAEARAAQPKSEPEHKARIPAEAQAARTEAPAKRVRVEAKKARAEAPPPNNPNTRPGTYQQTPFFDKFSIRIIEAGSFRRARWSPTYFPRPMSALGQKQTFCHLEAMSALSRKADMCGAVSDVR